MGCNAKHYNIPVSVFGSKTKPFYNVRYQRQVSDPMSGTPLMPLLMIPTVLGKSEEVTFQQHVECPNPVFQWVELLKAELNVDLRDATSQEQLDHIVATVLLPNDSLVRDILPDALSSRFARECVNAGYPVGFFSFHSLRIGWLCSAVINGLRQGLLSDTETALTAVGKGLASILSLTRIVAGWKSEEVQFGYIKEPLREVLNSVGIVLGEDCKSISDASPTGQVIMDVALDPVHFHKLERLMPAKGAAKLARDDEIHKLLFKPWMADVEKRKLDGSIQAYALAPHYYNHLGGRWRMDLYREICAHVVVPFLIEFGIIFSWSPDQPLLMQPFT